MKKAQQVAAAFLAANKHEAGMCPAHTYQRQPCMPCQPHRVSSTVVRKTSELEAATPSTVSSPRASSRTCTSLEPAAGRNIQRSGCVTWQTTSWQQERWAQCDKSEVAMGLGMAGFAHTHINSSSSSISSGRALAGSCAPSEVCHMAWTRPRGATSSPSLAANSTPSPTPTSRSPSCSTRRGRGRRTRDCKQRRQVRQHEQL